MLCVSALRSAASSIVAMSPSKNACCIRVSGASSSSGSRYRFDPYACRVLASPVKSPMAIMQQQGHHQASPTRGIVPRANRLMDIFASAPAASIPSNATPAPVMVTPAPAAPARAATANRSAAADASASAAQSVRYAFVRMKYDTMTFVAPFRVAVGDLVVVEGDRGENLGEVQDILAEKPSYAVTARILRKATPRDREQLEAKRQKELQATRSSQSLADSLGLSLTIADTEFQFDYGKLTVYFRSKSRHTDFRKLQRGLFREFRCRIWLTEAYRHISPDPAPAKAA